MSAHYILARPTEAEHILRGLRVLLAGPEIRPGGGVREDDVERQLATFLSYATSANIDTSRQVLALDGGWPGRAAGMCLWVESAGHSAMLFAPSARDFPAAEDAGTLCAQECLVDAHAAGVILAQTMVDPIDTAGRRMFAACDLTELATLVYMERTVPLLAPSASVPTGYTLLPYNDRTHPGFCTAIQESYDGTLDCPALSGLRGIEDVVAGHKAASGPGRFDPTLWSLVLEGTRPVGCLLLAHTAARQALDVVYLGLSPAARGRGVGRSLMQRTLVEAYARKCGLCTLAVDERNIPAMKLYRRFGYSASQRRVAMIRKLQSNIE